MTVRTIRVSDIQISDEIMPRHCTDRDTSLEYREAYEAGATLPPIVVFEDDDQSGRYWLADGWHRLDAQRALRADGEDPEDDDGDMIATAKDATSVAAEIHPGGKIAAMFYAAGANITHGRRRDAWDAIAAAKVAIRALTLQNPERRPTFQAVRDAARVGTDVAQRAFKEMEHEAEAEAATLPPKDPRGGARVLDFVTPVTKSASPDLDESGMLPVIDYGEEEVAKPRATTARPYRPTKITVPMHPEQMADVILQWLDDSEVNALIGSLGRRFE